MAKAAKPLSTYSTVNGKKQSKRGIENNIVRYSSFHESLLPLIASTSQSISPAICFFFISVSALIAVNYFSAFALRVSTYPPIASLATPKSGLINICNIYILINFV